jgi:acetyl esterase
MSMQRDEVFHAPDGVELLARLYLPAGEGPFPAVVSVHGGRWCAETRTSNAVLDNALADAGIVVMAIDFRMPPAVRYPLPVADINFAIRWLKLHAQRLGSAPHLVGGLGTSSGGHQMMLNALRPADPSYVVDALPDGAAFDARLAWVVAGWPVTDPLARYHMAVAREMEIHVQSHHAYWPDLAAMQQGNPQLIVERGEAQFLPPGLVVQGTADTVLTPDMADRFAAAYQEAGGVLELRKYQDQPHTFITKDPEAAASRAAIGDIAAFILRQVA